MDLTKTFIGLNMIRNDPTNTDLVRSFIENATNKWSSSDVAEIENYLAEVFTDDEKPTMNCSYLLQLF